MPKASGSRSSGTFGNQMKPSTRITVVISCIVLVIALVFGCNYLWQRHLMSEADALYNDWISTATSESTFDRLKSDNYFIRLVRHPYGDRQFMRSLHHEKQRIRDLSAQALAGSESKEVISMLETLRHDKNDFRRERAISVLTNSKKDEVVPFLLDSLKNDPWPQNRENAARSLRYFIRPETVDALKVALTDEDRVASVAVESLGYSGDTTFIDQAGTVLDRVSHKQFTEFCIDGLARTKTPAALAHIIRKLRTLPSDDWGQRYCDVLKPFYKDMVAPSSFPKTITEMLQWWDNNNSMFPPEILKKAEQGGALNTHPPGAWQRVGGACHAGCLRTPPARRAWV